MTLSRQTGFLVAANALLLGLAFAAGRWVATPEKAFAAEREPAGAGEAARPRGTDDVPAARRGPSVDAVKLRDALAAGAVQPGSQRALDDFTERLLALAAVDPRMALDLAAQRLEPPLREETMSKVLAVWAERNPDSAWAWAKAGAGKSCDFADTVLGKVAEAQPDLAWEFATELAPRVPDEAAGLYVSALRGMMFAGSYEEAARLLVDAKLPPQAANADYGLGGFLASSWAAFDPESAGEWVSSLPADSRARKQALAGLAQSWPEVDPRGAADFAKQLPPGAERVAMLSAAVNGWYASAPEQVGNWIANIPRGADYDEFAAAISTAPRIVAAGPENSIAWARSISDESLQVDSLARIFTAWIGLADAPAFAYLQDRQMFPPGIRAKLIRRLGLNMP